MAGDRGHPHRPGASDRRRPARAAGAHIPPFGMVHSGFSSASLHIGATGLGILSWGRAFTGPGLLDLVAWQDTAPLEVGAVDELITGYVHAGGPPSARADRGGIPAAAWAGGWHRVVLVDRLLERAAVWTLDPPSDPAMIQVVRRYLGEALTLFDLPGLPGPP